MASRVQIKQARRVPQRKHELEQNSQYSEALSSFGSGISDNKMTAEEQKARRSDRIKFLILALVVIAVFYFVLYQVIGYVDRVRRDVTTTEAGAQQGGAGRVGCGADSFMLRDGVCDEATNTAICVYDGGDCCRQDKDTSMCKNCTCRLKVDEPKIDSLFEQHGVSLLKEPTAFNAMIGENLVVKVQDVLSVAVCTVLCLDHNKDKEKVNAWHFSGISRTCRCAWIESTACIGEGDLQFDTQIPFTVQSHFATVAAYVQMNKMIPCNCVGINSSVNQNLTYIGRTKIPDQTHSAWHCLQECLHDFECTIFSFNVNDKSCKLMEEKAGHVEVIFEEGTLLSVKDCSKLKDFKLDDPHNTTDDSSNSTSEMSTTSTTEKSIYSDFQTPTFTERLTAGETGELGYIAGSMAHVVDIAVSGVHDDCVTICVGKWIVDRHFSGLYEEGTFVSTLDHLPWIQLEFSKSISVHRVVVVNRAWDSGERFHNVYFHIGDSPFVKPDGTFVNPICFRFTGTSVHYAIHDFQCDQVLEGTFVQVQMRRQQEPSHLQLSELLVLAYEESGYPVPENIHLSASSTVQDHEVSLAMDSFVGTYAMDLSFHTAPESYPWFQMELQTEVEIQMVLITQRIDHSGGLFENVRLSLGNSPASKGELSSNLEIGYFDGPSQTGRIELVSCNSTAVKGRYFIMQKTTEGYHQRLMFGEVIVYITENLCMSDDCGRSPKPEDLPNKNLFQG